MINKDAQFKKMVGILKFKAYGKTYSTRNLFKKFSLDNIKSKYDLGDIVLLVPDTNDFIRYGFSLDVAEILFFKYKGLSKDPRYGPISLRPLTDWTQKGTLYASLRDQKTKTKKLQSPKKSMELMFDKAATYYSLNVGSKSRFKVPIKPRVTKAIKIKLRKQIEDGRVRLAKNIVETMNRDPVTLEYPPFPNAHVLNKPETLGKQSIAVYSSNTVKKLQNSTKLPISHAEAAREILQIHRSATSTAQDYNRAENLHGQLLRSLRENGSINPNAEIYINKVNQKKGVVQSPLTRLRVSPQKLTNLLSDKRITNHVRKLYEKKRNLSKINEDA